MVDSVSDTRLIYGAAAGELRTESLKSIPVIMPERQAFSHGRQGSTAHSHASRFNIKRGFVGVVAVYLQGAISDTRSCGLECHLERA